LFTHACSSEATLEHCPASSTQFEKSKKVLPTPHKRKKKNAFFFFRSSTMTIAPSFFFFISHFSQPLLPLPLPTSKQPQTMAEAAKTDPLLAVALAMRAPKKQGGQVPWRNAVMGESRVEFFRHKDAVEFLAARPDLLGLAGAKPLPAADSPQARAAAGAVLELLVRRGAAVRAERIFWKPRPGMKRVAKFPKKLRQVAANAPATDAEGQRADASNTFYAWTFDRDSSPWALAGGLLLVVAVIAACLFPLAPRWVKLGVVYVSGGLLAILLGLLCVRGALAGLTWAATGKALWLFPNLMDDDKGFKEAFLPRFQWCGRGGSPDGAAAPLYARAAAVLAVAGVAGALLHFGPDAAVAAKRARAAHDALLESLNLHDPGRARLGGSVGGGSGSGGVGGGAFGGGSGSGGEKAEKATTAPPPPSSSSSADAADDAGASAEDAAASEE